MDTYRIDSHKLMFHPRRVAAWLAGETIYPLYVEVSPSGVCNHRCSFCALDYVGYHEGFLDADVLEQRLTEMAALGVKSVLYAGEGEPLLHRRMAEIVRHTKESGIDVALTTNAVLLTPMAADEILPHVTWTKVSIAAGTPETYAKIQGTRPQDFGIVIDNMRHAAEARRAGKHGCTLGMQVLLLPENAGEITELARIAKEIGMDYLVVKPYSQHLFSLTHKYEGVRYADYLPLEEELRHFDGDGFEVIFRAKSMQKWDRAERDYERCCALPFWAYMSTAGGVWGCSTYLGDERFMYGSIYDNTFREIWEGEKRVRNLRMVAEELDTARCRVNCRMDEINRFLWELKHPSAHVNFI